MLILIEPDMTKKLESHVIIHKELMQIKLKKKLLSKMTMKRSHTIQLMRIIQKIRMQPQANPSNRRKQLL